MSVFYQKKNECQIFLKNFNVVVCPRKKIKHTTLIKLENARTILFKHSCLVFGRNLIH
jgi:hypothetical protein